MVHLWSFSQGNFQNSRINLRLSRRSKWPTKTRMIVMTQTMIHVVELNSEIRAGESPTVEKSLELQELRYPDRLPVQLTFPFLTSVGI